MMMMRNLLMLVLVSYVAAATVQAPDRANLQDNVIGKVTSVSKDSVTLAPLAGGGPVTLKIGESTRIMKERQPAKLDEIKVDETVFARGKLNGSVMDTVIIGVMNPEMVQRLQQGGMTGGFNREDMGKKFIVGEVKAINETRLTIARPDGQTQEIEVDENTSFKKGTESVTLPDVKVGDFVRGRGEVKNNVFVPKELIVGRPQMRVMPMDGNGGRQQKKPDVPSQPAAPSSTPPSPK
jgi:hypothetical protein